MPSNNLIERLLRHADLGAHAYYMHGVLHDWSDKSARKILEVQKEAMKSSCNLYSTR